MSKPYKTEREGNKIIHYFAKCLCRFPSRKGLSTYQGDAYYCTKCGAIKAKAMTPKCKKCGAPIDLAPEGCK